MNQFDRSPPVPFILNYIATHSDSFRSYAAKLGLPFTAAVASASAVAEEMRSVYSADGSKAFRDTILDLNAGRFSDQVYANKFLSAQKLIADGSLNSRNAGVSFFFDKATNPMADDTGPGNINFGSASSLLLKYLNDASNANDPLDLRRYAPNAFGDFVGPISPSDIAFSSFYKDLNSLESPTTSAVSMLNIAAGYKFFTDAYGPAFSNLASGTPRDQQTQVGLLAAFSKMGETAFVANERFDLAFGQLPNPGKLAGGGYAVDNFATTSYFLSGAPLPAFASDQILADYANNLFGSSFDDRWNAINEHSDLGAYQQSVRDAADFIDSTNQAIANYAPIGDGNGIGSLLEQAQQYISPPALFGSGSPQSTGKRGDLEQQFDPNFGDDSSRTEFAYGVDSVLQDVGKATVGLFNFFPIGAPMSTPAEPSPRLDQANKVMFAEADGDRNSDWRSDITGSLGNGAGTLTSPSNGVAGVTALLSWGQPLGSSPSLDAPSLEAPATTATETSFTAAPALPVRSSTPWYYDPYQGPPPGDAFTGFSGGVDPFLVTPQHGNSYGGPGSYLVGYYGDGTPAYRHVETPEEAFPNGVDPYLVAPIIQAPSNDDPMVYINVPGGTSYMEPYSEYYNNNFVNPDPSSADYIGPHYSPTYSSESYGNGYHGSDVYYGGSYYSGGYYGDSYYSDSYYSDSYYSDSYYSVGDYGGGGDGGWGGGDESEPVVLDLTGKGISITQLGSSNHYFSFGGDGLQEATAWAGPATACWRSTSTAPATSTSRTRSISPCGIRPRSRTCRPCWTCSIPITTASSMPATPTGASSA